MAVSTSIKTVLCCLESRPTPHGAPEGSTALVLTRLRPARPARSEARSITGHSGSAAGGPSGAWSLAVH